jgi:hypothetical protein
MTASLISSQIIRSRGRLRICHPSLPAVELTGFERVSDQKEEFIASVTMLKMRLSLLNYSSPELAPLMLFNKLIRVINRQSEATLGSRGRTAPTSAARLA